MDSYSMSKVVSITWYSDRWKGSGTVLKSSEQKLKTVCKFLFDVLRIVLRRVRMCLYCLSSAHLQCLRHISTSPRLAQLGNVWKKCSNQNVWHSLLPIILIKIVQHPYNVTKISIGNYLICYWKNYKEQ